MIYRIYYEGKRKFALPIKNREELMALRNSQQNLSNLNKVLGIMSNGGEMTLPIQ